MLAGYLTSAAAYGGAGGEGLEATAVTAGAAWAGGLDGDVSELAARALRAEQQHAVRDHASPDPRAECEEHEVVHVAPRPEAELAPGGGVGVVLDRQRDPDPRLDLILQGDALHGVQIGREDHPVLLREDQARHGEARPSDLESFLHL
jgi:hypothetical protein